MTDETPNIDAAGSRERKRKPDHRPEDFTRALVELVRAHRDLVDARRKFYAANLQAPAAHFVEKADVFLDLARQALPEPTSNREE
jgi:hypothetical protein